jgi:hypothetical protein
MAAARFRIDEEITFAGKPVRVAGWVQYEDANAQPLTRYLLAEAGGAPLILEESGGNFFLLRPFAPGAQPQPVGSTITVMNEKYTLSGVRKLKVLATAGQPPGGMPRTELLVSGLFAGEMGSLLRELPAGASTQVFFSSKRVAADEVLSGEQLSAHREAERLAAEARALAADDAKDPGAGKSIQIVALAVAGILILLGLVYAYLNSQN